MKKISLIFLSLFVLAIVACSSGFTTYNPSICKEVSEKMGSGESLSDKDYTIMIDQVVAISHLLNDKNVEAAGDPEKLRDLSQDETLKEASEYMGVFMVYINNHQEDIPKSILKKWANAKKEMGLLR